MNKTQRKRLLLLAEFIVEQVPQDRFYMGSFCRYGTVTADPNECGTQACALGWTTVLFRSSGVKMDAYGPRYKRTSGFDIAVPLFGLTRAQSVALFTGEKYKRSAKWVRRDILRLVAKFDKEKNNGNKS